MGNLHCQISGFLMGLSVIGSIFNITAIAINRYCYICHSLRYDKLFNLKNTCCYLCLTWILTVVAIVPNFFVGSLQYDPRIYSCTFAQTVSTSYTITVVVVHFIVPLSVVTFCYLRIWILVIQVKHRVRQDCKQKLRAADIRNFLTMFVVFVLFAVCWGPLNFIGLAVSINPSKVQPHIPEWLFVLSYFMAYFNSCLNAVIYGLLNQNFRKEYKRILLTLWTPRLLFIDVSKGGTEGMKSKHSPAITTNNNHAEIHLWVRTVLFILDYSCIYNKYIRAFLAVCVAQLVLPSCKEGICNLSCLAYRCDIKALSKDFQSGNDWSLFFFFLICHLSLCA